MKAAGRVGLLVMILAVASTLAGVATLGCGGGDDGSDAGGPTTVQSDTSASSETTEAQSEQNQGQVELAVSGMPAEFPSDVPVHPGTVTAYEKTEVTETTTVHQLTVESAASFDDVVEWYRTQLPVGWSVGFIEAENGEGKIALDGGTYAPASPDGMGGGVIVGVFEGDKTRIVTTVTVMAP